LTAHLSRIATLIGLATSLLSCVVAVQRSGVPDYGRARVLQGSSDELEELEVLIPYRPLTRADFKAEAPRPEVAKHAKNFGAYTCVLLPARIEREMDVAYDAAAGTYVATLADVEYVAVMAPNCSWWNESNSSLPPEYVLQHEQIHFMLAEIQARRVVAKVRNMQGSATSHVEATLKLQEQLDSAVRDATPAFLAAANRFDDDTSARYAPTKQAEWLAYAEAELERLPAGAGRRTESNDGTHSGSSREPL
jgi:hypothetical protein